MPSLPTASLTIRKELEQTNYADVLRRVHGHDGPLSETERRVKLFWLVARVHANTKSMNDILGVTLQAQDVRDLMIPLLGPAAEVLSPNFSEEAHFASQTLFQGLGLSMAPSFLSSTRCYSDERR